jgi:2,4-dienoyl-CoA reductase-like NADH-dependent reductase (Old Yellow Enzyme family)
MTAPKKSSSTFAFPVFELIPLLSMAPYSAQNYAIMQPAMLGGSIPLRNRISMGAMTRNRCTDNNKPTEASIKHYATRAKDGTGLIVVEGVFIYLTGCDWIHAPVMFKDEHAEAWKKVTDAVHQEGGKIFFQAWHAGKYSFDGKEKLLTNKAHFRAFSK